MRREAHAGDLACFERPQSLWIVRSLEFDTYFIHHTTVDPGNPPIAYKVKDSRLNPVIITFGGPVML